MSRRKWIFTLKVVRPESKNVTHWMPSISIYNNSLGLSPLNDRGVERWKTRFRSLFFLLLRILTRSMMIFRIESNRITFSSKISFTSSRWKRFSKILFFLPFFFFLNPNRWKDVGESRFFFFFFFQHLDNFLKSWPIKNLLALNTNEISLAGAKLSPLLGFLKFFPISEEIKSEKEGKEKKRKEGKKR